MTKDIVAENEYVAYFGRYIDKVDPSTELKDGLEKSAITVPEFFAGIAEEKQDHAYAAGKWTIKEVFQHLIDTERVFAYRLFRIARGDKSPLTSFDQDIYIAPSLASEKAMQDLVSEFQAARHHTLSLVNSLNESALAEVGTASGHALSARAVAFIILGHELWHMDIVKERYLD